jgi:hypothetical protein
MTNNEVPVFGKWRRAYLVVIAVELVVIVLLYILTNYYK